MPLRSPLSQRSNHLTASGRVLGMRRPVMSVAGSPGGAAALAGTWYQGPMSSFFWLSGSRRAL